LADFCDVFRCDLHEQYPILRTNFPACNLEKMRKLQSKCEVTLVSFCTFESPFFGVYLECQLPIKNVFSVLFVEIESDHMFSYFNVPMSSGL